MRILVTGGTGFIGSHTVRALRAAGHDVKLLVRDGDQLRRYVGLEIDPIVSREASRFATQWVELDASQTTQTLGVPFRPTLESLYEGVRWLAETGHVDPSRALRFTHPGHGRR